MASKVMGDEPVNCMLCIKATLTATFNGSNGATGGSVAKLAGTQYYNNGNIANLYYYFLPANGYSRTNYV